MKAAIATLKPYLRWVILGGTVFFLISTLRHHWQEVLALRVSLAGWGFLGIGLTVTLLAHIWAGWVWAGILRELQQPAQGLWGVGVYLRTNIAKYLPGNIWHFYGRVRAAQQAGVSLGAATLSIVLEPLLMAASALAIALFSSIQGHWYWQLLSLVVVLVGVHPRFLNPLLTVASRLKTQSTGGETPEMPLQLQRYPWLPLLGEFLFVGLRGTGFVFTGMALKSIAPEQILPLISAFSVSWLLGLVIPGAPGGIGVFEATAIALLHSQFPAAVILGMVALYRLISTLAEAIGAAVAWCDRPKGS